MNYIKKFGDFLKESTLVAEMPLSTKSKETTKPEIPTKPVPPVKPNTVEIEQPSQKPGVKAITEMDVVNRFIDEVNKMGESVKKYIK